MNNINNINIRNQKNHNDKNNISKLKNPSKKIDLQRVSYQLLHQSLLTGFLGNIGCKDIEGTFYRGCRGIQFHSVKTRFNKKADDEKTTKQAKWLVAAELMETNRIYAKTVAKIEPQWLEQSAGHLFIKSYHNPRWDLQKQHVVTDEQALLLGLTIYQGRKINYGTLIRQQKKSEEALKLVELAQEIFIKEALIPQKLWEEKQQQFYQKQQIHKIFVWQFLAHNTQLFKQLSQLEHQKRRLDVLIDDDDLAILYDQKIKLLLEKTKGIKENQVNSIDDVNTIDLTSNHYNDGIYSTEQLQKILEQFIKHFPREKNPLFLEKHELQKTAGHHAQQFYPQKMTMNGHDFKLTYFFSPNDPKDGVTTVVSIKNFGLVDAVQGQWLVPGLLKEKVLLLLKQLPQKWKRTCIPLEQWANEFVMEHIENTDVENIGSVKQVKSIKSIKPLLDVLAEKISQQAGVLLPTGTFRTESLPNHLLMNYRLEDEKGRFLALERDWHQIYKEFGGIEGHGHQALQTKIHRQTITDYSVFKQQNWETQKKLEHGAIVFPMLELQCVENGKNQEIEIILTSTPDPKVAQEHNLWGLVQLIKLQMKDSLKALEKQLNQMSQTQQLEQLAKGKISQTLQSLKALKSTSTSINISHNEQENKNNDKIIHKNLAQQLIDAILLPLCHQWNHGDYLPNMPQNEEEFIKRVTAVKNRLGLLAQEGMKLLQQIHVISKEIEKSLNNLSTANNSLSFQKQDIQKHFEGLMGSHNLLESASLDLLKELLRYLQGVKIRIEKTKSNPEMTPKDKEQLTILQKWEQKIASHYQCEHVGQLYHSGILIKHLSQNPSYQELAKCQEVLKTTEMLQEIRISLFAQSIKTRYPASLKRLEKMFVG